MQRICALGLVSYAVPCSTATAYLHPRHFCCRCMRSSPRRYTYIDEDTPAGRLLDVPINETFWERGGWAANAALDNPWAGRGANAPFDQRFYLIINVAVGGVNGTLDAPRALLPVLFCPHTRCWILRLTVYHDSPRVGNLQATFLIAPASLGSTIRRRQQTTFTRGATRGYRRGRRLLLLTACASGKMTQMAGTTPGG